MKYLRNQWDRVVAWLVIALGALFLLLGWLGVSDALLTTEQLPYIISGGLGGVCLVGVGAMLWLSADLRDEWTELHEIVRRLEAMEPGLPWSHERPFGDGGGVDHEASPESNGSAGSFADAKGRSG